MLLDHFFLLLLRTVLLASSGLSRQDLISPELVSFSDHMELVNMDKMMCLIQGPLLPATHISSNLSMVTESLLAHIDLFKQARYKRMMIDAGPKEIILDVYARSLSTAFLTWMAEGDEQDDGGKLVARRFVCAAIEIGASVDSLLRTTVNMLLTEEQRELSRKGGAIFEHVFNCFDLDSIKAASSHISLLIQTVLPRVYNDHSIYYVILQTMLRTSHRLLSLALTIMEIITPCKSLPCTRNFMEVLQEEHYTDLGMFLCKCWGRGSNKSLSLPLLKEILETHPPSIYHELILQGILPESRIIRQFILTNENIQKNLPEVLEWVKEKIEKDEQTAVQALLESLIPEDVPVCVGGKKTSVPQGKGKLKGKGKKKAVKKQKNKAPVKKEDESCSIETLIKSVLLPSSYILDPRDRSFGILIVAQHLLTKYLHPLIDSLSPAVPFDGWSQIEAVLAGEIGPGRRLVKRKGFLLNCIEWVKMRNGIAHPSSSGAISSLTELGTDLVNVSLKLGEEHSARISILLEKMGVPPVKNIQQPPFAQGRPPSFESTNSTLLTLSCIRLSQHLLDRIILPTLRQRMPSARPSLSLLQSWHTSTAIPLESLGLSEADLQALISLLALRNILAHPKAKPAVVKEYLNALLFDDPSMGPFLSKLISD